MLSRSYCFAGVLALASLSGCTSPETASEPMVTGVSAVGLTYATGDPKEGTVTVASLPLLSYYHFHEDPRTHGKAFRLCWIPLLGSLGSESHDITDVVATLAAPPSCPGDEPPVPPAPAPSPAPKKGRIVIRMTDDEDLPPSRPSAASRLGSGSSPAPTSPDPVVAPSPVRSTPPTPDPRPAAPVAVRRGPSNGAKILSTEPATRTEVDFFFPLFHFERARPGTAIIQRPGRKKSVVEVGDSADHVRALPLFSYRRDAERERLILWPLLASGYDDDAEGRHLVLLYFIKIRTGDPEKP